MPVSPPRPSPKHPTVLLGRGATCPQCPKHNWVSDKMRGNRHQRGYGKQWDKLRLVILRRDNYLCQHCKSNGHMVAAKDVDHIIPKSQGGTDSTNNLMSLCSECHKHKSSKE